MCCSRVDSSIYFFIANNIWGIFLHAIHYVTRVTILIIIVVIISSGI